MFAAKHETDAKALDLLENALSDKSWRIRSVILNQLNMENDTVKRSIESYLLNVAKNDSRSLIRAQAIDKLGQYKNLVYKPLLMKALHDSSYSVAGSALEALAKIDDAGAEAEAKKLLSQPAKGTLKDALSAYIDENKFDSIAAKFNSLPVGNAKFNMLNGFALFLARVKNTDNLKKGVDMIVSFRDTIPQAFRGDTDPFINDALRGIAEKKQAQGLKEQEDYVRSKIPAEKKD